MSKTINADGSLTIRFWADLPNIDSMGWDTWARIPHPDRAPGGQRPRAARYGRRDHRLVRAQRVVPGSSCVLRRRPRTTHRRRRRACRRAAAILICRRSSTATAGRLADYLDGHHAGTGRSAGAADPAPAAPLRQRTQPRPSTASRSRRTSRASLAEQRHAAARMYRAAARSPTTARSSSCTSAVQRPRHRGRQQLMRRAATRDAGRAVSRSSNWRW